MRTVRQCILLFSGDAVGFRHLLCGVPIRNPVEYSATAGGTGIKSRKRKREKFQALAQRAGFVDINQHARQFY